MATRFHGVKGVLSSWGNCMDIRGKRGLRGMLSNLACRVLVLPIMKKILRKYQLTDRDIDRIISMAWEDRTPFDAITEQFGLSETEVIKVMRSEMHPRSWRNWRARVQGRSTKHRKSSEVDDARFKSTRQRQISRNKISKRHD